MAELTYILDLKSCCLAPISDPRDTQTVNTVSTYLISV